MGQKPNFNSHFIILQGCRGFLWNPKIGMWLRLSNQCKQLLKTTWIVSVKLTFLFQAVCLYFYLYAYFSLSYFVYLSISFSPSLQMDFFSLSCCEMGATTLIPDSSGTLFQSPNAAPTTNSISFTCEIIINVKYQGPPQINRIRSSGMRPSSLF